MPLGLVRAENNVGENMEVYKDKVGKVKKKKKISGMKATACWGKWKLMNYKSGDETGLSHPVA